MLVITQKAGQAFQIGPDVTVRIVEVHGNRAILGIEAPKSIRISRLTPMQRLETAVQVKKVLERQGEGG